MSCRHLPVPTLSAKPRPKLTVPARRTAAVVRALPCRTWPIAHPSIPTRRVHHQSPGPNSYGLDLGRTEAQVRGAIRALENVGLLDRAISGKGSRHKPTDTG